MIKREHIYRAVVGFMLLGTMYVATDFMPLLIAWLCYIQIEITYVLYILWRKLY